MYSSWRPVTSSRSNVGTLEISNQPVSGSIIVIQVRLKLFLMIAPPGYCCLIVFLYEPTRSTCKESHSFCSAMFLGGRCPLRVFYSELLTYLARLSIQLCLCEKDLPVAHLTDFLSQSNTTGMVEIEMVPIYRTSMHSLNYVYLDHSRLSPHCQDIVWSKRIPNLKCMHRIYFSHLFLLSYFNI